MTRAHKLIIIASAFGMFSIVFDHVAYQFEKRASSLQIEINQLRENERDYTNQNGNNADFIGNLERLIKQLHGLYRFLSWEDVKNDDNYVSFDDVVITCWAESLLRKQIHDFGGITERYLASSSLSKYIDSEIIENTTKVSASFRAFFNEAECQGITAGKYKSFIDNLRAMKKELDFIFEFGELSYKAAQKANELESRLVKEETIFRFSLLTSIALNILALIVLLEFFKTVNFRRSAF
mgnify:CR=1 FL=1